MSHFSKISLFVSTALVTGAALSSMANAQLTPSSEPQRLQRQYEERGVRSGDAAIEQQGAVQRAAQKDDSRKVSLKTVEFDGMTAYSADEMQAMFSGLVGRTVTLGEIRDVAEQINAKYRTDGYLLSRAEVRSQDVSGSRVKVRVTEGYIGSVSIEGDHKENTSVRNLIMEYGNKITSERPLKAKTLERYLLLVDDLPGVTAKGLVRRPDASGASGLIILLNHKMWEASLTEDNRGTRFIGRQRHSATVSENSALGLYERTTFRYITASPIQELEFWDIQHEQQVGSEGTKLVFVGSHVKTEPGDILKPLLIEGTSDFLMLQARSPFIRSRKENFEGRATFDYRNSENDALGVLINEDRIRAIRFGLDYDRADTFFRGVNGVNQADLEVSQGLDVLNATNDGAGRSRTDGEHTFTKVNLNLAREQQLPWAGFSILGALSGQYAFDALLSAEEFAIGGLGFGNAYDSAELTGDHGAAAKVELRYGDLIGKDWFNSYQLYSYWDVAKIWQKNAAALGIEEENSLASAGLGVRANFTPWLSGTGEVAFPLTRNVSAEGDDDTRLFFSVTGRF